MVFQWPSLGSYFLKLSITSATPMSLNPKEVETALRESMSEEMAAMLNLREIAQRVTARLAKAPIEPCQPLAQALDDLYMLDGFGSFSDEEAIERALRVIEASEREARV